MSTAMLRADEQPNGRPDAGERGRVAPTLALAQQFELLGTEQRGMERLRALVLRLAVQGKLVPQRVDDEPAHLLLQRSRAAAAERMKAGQAKREAPADPVKASEQPFALPNGWTWARVVDTGEYINGMAFKPTDWSEVGRPIIRIQNLSGRSSVFNRTRMDVDSSVVVSAGDVLVSWSATLDAFIWEGEEGVLNQHIFRVVPSAAMAKAYLFLLLKHVISELANSRHAHGLVMMHINRGPFLDHPVAIPPLAEQHRIVARVEELMKLCDALEAKQRLADEQHARLTSTLFEALAASESVDVLMGNWQRVAEHFDSLLDRSSAVDQFEQAIVTMAIRGRVVPQVASDEPASVLQARIRDERTRLFASGNAKRDKPFSAVTQQECPFPVPAGWSWVRFDELVRADKPIAYGVLVPGPDDPTGVPFVRLGDLSLDNPAERPEKSISPTVDAQFARTRLEGGEILLGVVGSVGKLGVAPASWRGANIARAICRIVPTEQVDRGYVLMLLQSQFMKQRFIGDTRTLAQPTLNVSLIRQCPTPLPPLAEQRRIVARVDELRRLCAQLRGRLSTGREVQSRLADALVASVA